MSAVQIHSDNKILDQIEVLFAIAFDHDETLKQLSSKLEEDRELYKEQNVNLKMCLEAYKNSTDKVYLNNNNFNKNS